jgi:hypothetical protein
LQLVNWPRRDVVFELSPEKIDLGLEFVIGAEIDRSLTSVLELC